LVDEEENRRQMQDNECATVIGCSFAESLNGKRHCAGGRRLAYQRMRKCGGAVLSAPSSDRGSQ